MKSTWQRSSLWPSRGHFPRGSSWGCMLHWKSGILVRNKFDKCLKNPLQGSFREETVRLRKWRLTCTFRWQLWCCVFAGIAPVGPRVEGVACLIDVVARSIVELPRSAAMSLECIFLVKVGLVVARLENFIDIPKEGWMKAGVRIRLKAEYLISLIVISVNSDQIVPFAQTYLCRTWYIANNPLISILNERIAY